VIAAKEAFYQKQTFVMIQEFCHFGSLRVAESFSEEVVKICLFDILSAIKNVHKYDRVHLKIRMESIFFNDSGFFKLGGFR
jgi:hypothetical protein